MALFPGMFNWGFWCRGSDQLDGQIIITDGDETIVNSYWVAYYLPGIY